jgi:hypothetical protein
MKRNRIRFERRKREDAAIVIQTRVRRKIGANKFNERRRSTSAALIIQASLLNSIFVPSSRTFDFYYAFLQFLEILSKIHCEGAPPTKIDIQAAN